MFLPRWYQEEEDLQRLEEALEAEGSDTGHWAKEQSKKADSKSLLMQILVLFYSPTLAVVELKVYHL